MSSRKRIVLILVALAVIALLWWSFQPEPVPVAVEEVRSAPLQVTIQQEGRTRVRDRYVVAAPVAGYAERLELEAGDAVKKGQVLLHVNPALSQPLDPRSRAQAEAQLREAEAAEQLARAELERHRALLESGNVSRSAFDQAQAAAARARANVAAARAALGDASGPAIGKRVPVAAPVSGRVLSIERKSEGPVAAGTPLLTLGDPGALEVAVDVLSSDAVRLSTGMRVLLDRWGGGERLEAQVRRIEPGAFTKISALGVEEQRVWVILDITSPREQWQDLGDAYRVEAEFILWEGRDVLQVPASALFRQGGGWAVFTVTEGVAHRRSVQIGQRGGLNVQILKGLAAGELVVTHPDDALEEGSEIVFVSGQT
jgi:HlyD family secretion protein